MSLEKMRPCLWKLELGFTVRLMAWHVFWVQVAQMQFVCPQTTRSSIFLRFYNFTGFILWFFRKGGSVCKNWSQGPWLMARYVFWVQVGCLGVNVVSTPQSPRSRIFLRLQNFIEFISWFLRKWVPAFENGSQDSGLTAAYVFWVQGAQT